MATNPNGKQEKELDSMTAMLAAQLLQQLTNRQLFPCSIN